MSLPPGFLDELRNRSSIAQVVGRKVMWDARKSNQGKGDYWAPCPFHHEKTASFHVDDQKGYYYCFGCQAKGDALGFIKETENVSFMEAVEILAGEVGMPMPARDPQAREKADYRSQLAEVMEQALQFYRLELRRGPGRAALDYIRGRGLDDAAIDRWELGFAPDGWQGLWDHLAGKGVSEKLIMDCGLAKPSNSGKRPYDTFRNRLMFPIRDARGRAIAFGGRAMDPNDGAKYLNSPETQLFDKGRNLYNLAPARAAVGKGQPLIVAEGYMDVIALSQAGFNGAVAPLGTAITDNQLALLWRVSDEPILALDGDTAGQRAALRAVDLALPLLEAGKSLRFAMMPAGQDPDDLIKSGGAAAMQAQIDAAQPMVQLLWMREVEGKNFDSPERKAALDKALRSKIKLIQDPSIRSHYGQAIKDLRWQLFRPARGGGFGARGRPVAQSHAKSTPLAQAGVAPWMLKEEVLIALLLARPEFLEQFGDALVNLPNSTAELDQVKRIMLRHLDHTPSIFDEIAEKLGGHWVETLFARPHVRVSPALRPGQMDEFVEQCLAQEFQQIQSELAHIEEVAEAENSLSDQSDEGLTWRIAQSAKSRAEATATPGEDKTEYTTAGNGARVKLDERAALDDLIKQIGIKGPSGNTD